MRKSKALIYFGLGFLLIAIILALGGYRLSPETISKELDQKAHFAPSEIIKSGMSGNVATVVTQRDTWIQCRTMTGILVLIWKADPYVVSPVDLSNPIFPSSEADMTRFYLDACQWSKYGVDPVLILKAADELVSPYLELDGQVLSHQINRIIKNAASLQVDSSIVFTSKGNTVTAKYVTYFQSEGGVNYGSRLNVNQISMASSFEDSAFWAWYHKTYIQAQDSDQAVLLQSFLVSEEITNRVFDLGKGVVTFRSVVTAKTLGWTGVETKNITAKYDLDLGWVFREVGETFVQTLDLSGSWKVDLYEAVDGPAIYITSIPDLRLSGLMVSTKTSSKETPDIVNTTEFSFTFQGKHYSGAADLQGGTLDNLTTGLIIDQTNDNALRMAYQFNRNPTDPSKYDLEVFVYVTYMYGQPVRIK